uniref:Putative secreted protein n=1 Tax=Panstrongylus lignarius TaxID=156445 RepID=A0A224Y019_9HEMI
MSLAVHLPRCSSPHRSCHLLVLFLLATILASDSPSSPFNSRTSFLSRAMRSMGITPATTRTAGSDTVRYALAILSAPLLCTAANRFRCFAFLRALAQTSQPYNKMPFVTDMSSRRLLALGPPTFAISLLKLAVTRAAFSEERRICSQNVSLLYRCIPKYLTEL